jgi:hypothetical protein
MGKLAYSISPPPAKICCIFKKFGGKWKEKGAGTLKT